ncbi:MAG: orotidine-5'-phosphate decarboxylase [Candidatus Altiarchaeota archaeon]|nr:orotidine-5'-phosphate decarboxylase [Candidatus Altiarchaeota archaeon]
MTKLLEKYLETRKEKNSILCVGLDPAPGEHREEAILSYCKDLVGKTSKYAAAYKPNSQFLFPLNTEELKELNDNIHAKGCISILDHKITDIGSSNEAALYWIKQAGFDAVTVSPFPGNISEVVESAHKNEVGVIVLTLMSNPQAAWIQKGVLISGKPLYQRIAEEVKSSGADGLVIGTTGHVTEEDLRTTRELAGADAIFLCPGVGAQGGDIEKTVKNAGSNLLINVGRAIISDPDPGKKAAEYAKLINECRWKYHPGKKF